MLYKILYYSPISDEWNCMIWSKTLINRIRWFRNYKLHTKDICSYEKVDIDYRTTLVEIVYVI